ncbi:MAG: hypothetical protein NTX61_15935 [Bacteroidetes bacterium]|nr:hypothetical protein [Bacteroidota bacterium]
MIFAEEQKTQPITRLQVLEAFKRVKANDGNAGVDSITIAQVEHNKRKYLYPLWNNCLLSPQPEKTTTIQSSLPEVRLFRIHLQTTDDQRRWQDEIGVHTGYESKEHSPKKRGIVQNEDSPLGSFSIDKDSPVVKSQDQRMDQLLFKIPEIGTTEVVPGGKSAAHQVGSQQVSEIQVSVPNQTDTTS